MKRFLKPILICIGGLLVLALLVTAVIFFIPRDNTSFSFECFRLRSAVSGFLKDVEKERYDDAFDRVYCVESVGATPIEDPAACRGAWIGRVADLRDSDNTYLVDHSDLKVRKQNGEFTVTVTLSVTRQGYNDPFYANGNVITAVWDDGWKIVSLSAYETALQTDLEKALSGFFVPVEPGEGDA